MTGSPALPDSGSRGVPTCTRRRKKRVEMIDEDLHLELNLLLATDVAQQLDRSVRWVEMLCDRGEFEGARKATDIEEVLLRRAGKIKRASARGVWLIPREAVTLTQKGREAPASGGAKGTHKVGFPRGRSRPKRGKLIGKGNASQ